MAETNSTNTGKKYLDEAGLNTFWGGVKKYVEGKFNLDTESAWSHSVSVSGNFSGVSSLVEIGGVYSGTFTATHKISGSKYNKDNAGTVEITATIPDGAKSYIKDSNDNNLTNTTIISSGVLSPNDNGSCSAASNQLKINFPKDSFLSSGQATLTVSANSTYTFNSDNTQKKSSGSISIYGRYPSYVGYCKLVNGSLNIVSAANDIKNANFKKLISSYNSATHNIEIPVLTADNSSDKYKCGFLFPVGVRPDNIPSCTMQVDGGLSSTATVNYHGWCEIDGIRYVLITVGGDSGYSPESKKYTLNVKFTAGSDAFTFTDGNKITL